MSAVAAGSRIDSSLLKVKLYRDRLLNDALSRAWAEYHGSCEGHGLDAISVRCAAESSLAAKRERIDGIISASSLEAFSAQFPAVTEGRCPPRS